MTDSALSLPLAGSLRDYNVPWPVRSLTFLPLLVSPQGFGDAALPLKLGDTGSYHRNDDTNTSIKKG